MFKNNNNDMQELEHLVIEGMIATDNLDTLTRHIRPRMEVFFDEKIEELKRAKRNNEPKINNNVEYARLKGDLILLQNTYIENWINNILDRINTLINYENNLKSNKADNEIINYLQTTTDLKDIALIEMDITEANTFELWANPIEMFEIKPIILKLEDVQFSLAEKDYGYGTDELDTNEYCHTPSYKEDIKFCKQFSTEQHPCAFSYISSKMDNCFFDAKEINKDENNKEINHAIEKQDSLYVLISKEPIETKELEDKHVSEALKYFLPIDTLKSEIKHLEIKKILPFQKIITKITDNEYWLVITMALAIFNISLIFMYCIQKIYSATYKWCKKALADSIEEIPEAIPLNNRQNIIKEKKVHFRNYK